MKRGLVALLCWATLVAGCGDASETTVDVFAASSLTDAFTELEQRFEADNPGVDIRLNLAGSDTLRRQIDDGADAAVFAPASIELFDGLDVAPTTYASNQLDVIVGLDAGLTERVVAGDLEGLVVARCADGVPCGTAADQLIASLELDLSNATVTSEANVRAVLAKVQLGEADVGLVYRTDAVAGGEDVRITGITDPSTRVILAIARLDQTNDAAAAFIEFVLASPSVFTSRGFQPTP